jgi:allophanate hydrolase
MNSITIERSGLLSTIQDEGRFNLRHLGIPWSGCMSPAWQKMCNALVGNELNNSVIECWEGGLQFNTGDDSLRIAVAADHDAAITITSDSVTLQLNPFQSYTAPPHSIIKLSNTGGFRHAVIAISGLDVSPQLGSTATYAKAGLGGLNGAALKAGDTLCVGTAQTGAEHTCTNPLSDAYKSAELRVVLGPQQDLFSDEGIHNLLNSDYTLGTDADRMGVRLAGPQVLHKNEASKNPVSDAIVLGSIQVPATGQPIVLLRDAHTAGGYPKVATVVSIDLPLLGLQRAGSVFQFRAISIDEAIDAVRQQSKDIAAAVNNLKHVLELSLTSETLLSTNLIDGVTNGDMP